MPMKLGLGLYRHMLTPPYLRFARQIGATHIVAHLPGTFVRDDDAIITSDMQHVGFGVSTSDDPIWTYEGLRDLRDSVESEGLELAALENFAPAHWYDVLLDGPRRAQQIERLTQLLHDVGRVGVPVFGYYFSIAGVWGRTEGPFARGGAVSVGFNDPLQTPIPNGMAWNMVYDPAVYDALQPRGVVGAVSSAEIWDRFARFLEDMLPVAEAAGVKLALHPDDPPLPVLRDAARLIHTADGYQRVLDLSDSPSNALEVCVGTLSEMPNANIYDMIDQYSRTGRIAYIHFRNVRGKAPHYVEAFIDDGDTDMIEVLRILHRNGFDGVLVPDHTPLVECDAPWHAGMAYALGYMRAALTMVEAEHVPVRPPYGGAA